jgi:hypothetical protein
MKATIYIPDERAEVYEQAKKELGESISATFLKCLQRELEAKRQKTERIVVGLYDGDNDRTTKKSFEGRWLIGDAEGGEKHLFDQERTGISGGGDYSVAVTSKGRLVLVTFDHKTDCPQWLAVYESFDDMKNPQRAEDALPESLISAIASELEVDHVEHMDI